MSLVNFTLDNEINVFIDNDPISTILYINVMINVGSINEPHKTKGISHFLEHLVFKHTNLFLNSKELFTFTGTNGISINASTSKDYTEYNTKSENNKLNESLHVLSEIIFNPIFDKKNIEKEKDVVLSEYMEGLSNSYNTIYRENESLVFKNTNYEHDVCGINIEKNNYKNNYINNYINYVKNITLQNLIDYHTLYYSKNISICISGNIKNLKNLKTLLNTKFKYNNKYNKYTKLISPINNLNIITNYKFKHISLYNIPQIYVSVSFFINNEDRCTADLLSILLGEGNSSRLFLMLREKYSLVYHIKCRTIFYKIGGIIEINFSLKEDQTTFNKCIELLFLELKNLKTNKIKQKELDKIKLYNKQAINNFITKKSNLCKFYNKQFIYNKINSFYNKNNNKSIDELLDLYNKISPDNICNLSKKLFIKEKLNIVILSSISPISNISFDNLKQFNYNI